MYALNQFLVPFFVFEAFSAPVASEHLVAFVFPQGVFALVFPSLPEFYLDLGQLVYF